MAWASSTAAGLMVSQVSLCIVLGVHPALLLVLLVHVDAAVTYASAVQVGDVHQLIHRVVHMVW